jgi:uncharacterized CHY-type Zn-finger protein
MDDYSSEDTDEETLTGNAVSPTAHGYGQGTCPFCKQVFAKKSRNHKVCSRKECQAKKVEERIQLKRAAFKKKLAEAAMKGKNDDDDEGNDSSEDSDEETLTGNTFSPTAYPYGQGTCPFCKQAFTKHSRNHKVCTREECQAKRMEERYQSRRAACMKKLAEAKMAARLEARNKMNGSVADRVVQRHRHGQAGSRVMDDYSSEDTDEEILTGNAVSPTAHGYGQGTCPFCKQVFAKKSRNHKVCSREECQAEKVEERIQLKRAAR